VNPWVLEPWQRRALEANIPKVQAREWLEQYAETMPAATLHDLMMLVTDGDRAAADKVTVERLQRDMKAGKEPNLGDNW
jgi:hypothetical protein